MVSPQVTVAVTGHHLILSLAEVQEKQGPREIWLLHRNIQVFASATVCIATKWPVSASVCLSLKLPHWANTFVRSLAEGRKVEGEVVQ